MMMVSGTTVLSLTCSDDDAGTNAALTYSISSGDDVGSEKFSMTGVNIITSATALNFESKITYTLTIHIVDGGTVPLTSQATVIVFVSVFHTPFGSGNVSIVICLDGVLPFLG